ncbi:MAG TPA: ATP-binding protein [bacterium]|nr:ATP-binding protein [bacterium]
MKELAIISGKGGTGKTSITASFAALAGNAVLADCDVDASDLHLILKPTVRRREDFSGGSRAEIDPAACPGCGKCRELCRFDAIEGSGDAPAVFRVDPLSCEGCGVCARFCPSGAIRFAPVVNGEWYVSDTRFGPMVHARLGPGEENSGKLVSLVRKEAGRIARELGRGPVIIDGSPGIGCPVIASITGADLVLAVTEPTLSGAHDLERVALLTRHFGVETLVCVNKWDLNPDQAAAIEALASRLGLKVAGKVRYDRAVTEAQVRGEALVENGGGTAAAGEIADLWARVSLLLR